MEARQGTEKDTEKQEEMATRGDPQMDSDMDGVVANAKAEANTKAETRETREEKEVREEKESREEKEAKHDDEAWLASLPHTPTDAHTNGRLAPAACGARGSGSGCGCGPGPGPEPGPVELHIASDIHLEEFASSMPPAAVHRYLAMMLPPPSASLSPSSSPSPHGHPCEASASRARQAPPLRHIAVLAGDIGNPCHCGATLEAAFDYVSRHFDAGVFVAGNHEYYQLRHGKRSRRAMSEVDARLAAMLARYPQVHWLRDPQQPLAVAGITFLGCTLWSATTAPLPDINDYRLVYVAKPSGVPRRRYGDALRLLHEGDTLALHRQQVAHLRSALMRLPAAALEGRMPVVVVTHHVPTAALADGRLLPASHGSAEAAPLLRLPGITAWVCGHTHDLIVQPAHRHRGGAGGDHDGGGGGGGECGLYCNAIGYPSEVHAAGRANQLRLSLRQGDAGWTAHATVTQVATAP